MDVSQRPARPVVVDDPAIVREMAALRRDGQREMS